MDNSWHGSFSPKAHLKGLAGSRQDGHGLYDHSAWRSGQFECCVCARIGVPGLRLNNAEHLCEICVDQFSRIEYPESTYKVISTFEAETSLWRAKQQLHASQSPYSLLRLLALPCAVLSTVTWLFADTSVAIPVMLFLAVAALSVLNTERSTEWELQNSKPQCGELKGFFDPGVVLSPRDRKVLTVFFHWPGYPPFWEQVREIVLSRDGSRCQVTGCPSQLTLHVHHIKPTSSGGAHWPSNLVTLCEFHHALEPDPGHHRIWANISNARFSLVSAHERSNRVDDGTHRVRAHLRRRTLVTLADIQDLVNHYGLKCRECIWIMPVEIKASDSGKEIHVRCTVCSTRHAFPCGIAEETGPWIFEVYSATQNAGTWQMNWEILEGRKKTKMRR